MSDQHNDDRPRLAVRPMRRHDRPEVLALVKGLHGWFNEEACARAIPMDLSHHRCFVAEVEGRVAGFVTLYVNEGRLHIGWMGVRRDLHRRGIGRRLLAAAEAEARLLDIAELAVFTPGESDAAPAYVPTRLFYAATGFRPFQRKRTDNPRCPEELHLIKPVTVNGAEALDARLGLSPAPENPRFSVRQSKVLLALFVGFLLLCIGLWIYSYSDHAERQLWFGGDSPDGPLIAFARGDIVFGYIHKSPDNVGDFFDHHTIFYRYCGVPGFIKLVAVPLWPVMLPGLAGALFSFRRLRSRLRSRSRHAAGQCIHCGYDMRATPRRCPECGREPPIPRRRGNDDEHEGLSAVGIGRQA